MLSDGERERLNKITEKVIGCCYAVANELGVAFNEKIYENSLLYELKTAGLSAEQQHPIRVLYKGVLVGSYVSDMLVENTVLLEFKAVKALDETHAAQCMNYLKATGLPICLLINFGTPKIQIKRFVNDF